MSASIICFAGPSLSPSTRTRQGVVFRSSARRGDIEALLVPSREPLIIVFVDAVFLHDAGPTHLEIMKALHHGCTVIGAASAGALRAVEMRAYGMVGVGVIYEAYTSGALNDDSELFVLMNPDNEVPATIPLVHVRAVLHSLEQQGLPPNLLRKAFECARNIYWMERTPFELGSRLRREAPAIAERLIAGFQSHQYAVKQHDCEAALLVARTAKTGRQQTLRQSKSASLYLLPP